MVGSVGACENACWTKEWCKSFDYYKNENKCDLSDKNKDDVGLETDWDDNPYDYYEKGK